MLQNLLASAKFKENVEPSTIRIKMQGMANTTIKLSELRDFIFLVSIDH